MVYGVLRFINFAHSDVFMVGAFAGYYLGRMASWALSFHWGERVWRLTVPACLVIPTQSLWGGLVILFLAMLACATLGVVIERLAYRPLRDHSKLNVLITAIGVSLLLENTGQFVFGAAPKSFPTLFPVKSFTFMGGLVLSSNQIAVLVVTALLLVSMRFIVLKTRMGTAMRA